MSIGPHATVPVHLAEAIKRGGIPALCGAIGFAYWAHTAASSVYDHAPKFGGCTDTYGLGHHPCTVSTLDPTKAVEVGFKILFVALLGALFAGGVANLAVGLWRRGAGTSE